MIRKKAIWFHRFSGYVSSVLLGITIATGMSLAPISFGAAPSLQVNLYAVGVMVAFAACYGISAVRNGDIDSHRKWMLRAWGWVSFIITLRLAHVVGIIIFGTSGNAV